ncbi:MAG: hypothetical protein JWM11_4539 [Planctomycetaceae bacterium]|nr:hypothetical protein [Planctomycetaceae bacterium]
MGYSEFACKWLHRTSLYMFDLQGIFDCSWPRMSLFPYLSTRSNVSFLTVCGVTDSR